MNLAFLSIMVMVSKSMEIIRRNDELHATYRLEDEFASYYGSLEDRDTTFNPRKIFIPETEEDIKSIVKIANKKGAQIVVKSGGHSYIGASSCNARNCYQIDMKYFNKTEFIRNPKTNEIESIMVGVGQKLGKLYGLCAAEHVVIIGGNCEGVGVGGHFQSSSIGAYTRSFGSGFDHIKTIKLINSKGHKQRVSKTSISKKERDLFWAILGSAPGSWGIILEYEFSPIFDADYPHNYVYVFDYYYNKEIALAILNEYMRVLNNPLLNGIQDIGAIYYRILNPTFDASDASEAHMLIALTWSGAQNGDIFGNIPGTNNQKTWYGELLSGFDAISGVLYEGKKLNATLPISTTMATAKATEAKIPIPPYRYYIQHSAFDNVMLHELGTNTNKYDLSLWMSDIIDAIDYIYMNATDIDLFFQLWNFQIPTAQNQIINGIEFDAKNPMNNAVSYPLRNIAIEFDNWLLFGNQYESTNQSILNKAWQLRQDLENRINLDLTQINDIETMAFPDIGYHDLGDINKEWTKYFGGNRAVYDKLRRIKTNVDPQNMFNGPLTIKPYKPHSEEL